MKISLEENAFTDIIFQLDDGIIAAHRALLSARCDVMRAMFSGNFKERSSKVVNIFCNCVYSPFLLTKYSFIIR